MTSTIVWNFPDTQSKETTQPKETEYNYPVVIERKKKLKNHLLHGNFLLFLKKMNTIQLTQLESKL